MKIIVRRPTEQESEEAHSWPIWEKSPSEFPWQYDEKETCLIIEGSAEVKTDEGSITFQEGDYVIFPKGLRCDWHIKEKIKKYYKFG